MFCFVYQVCFFASVLSPSTTFEYLHLPCHLLIFSFRIIFTHTDDIFTALDFDESGRYIALGDRAGRITVFETIEDGGDDTATGTKGNSTMPIEYKFFTEFQSHERGFDRLHSVEIEESINMIRWWKGNAPGIFMLSSNDTCVKMWKICHKKMRRRNRKNRNRVGGDGVESEAGGSIHIPSPSKHPKYSTEAVCKRSFNNAHGTCHIDSVSPCSDGETFISTDALKINLWNAEVSNECFNILNIKPPNLADLQEVITSAAFHPTLCNMLCYSTSLGSVKLCDLRQNALVKDYTKREYSCCSLIFFARVQL